MLEQLLMFMCQVFAIRGDVYDAMRARVPVLAEELRRAQSGEAAALSLSARSEVIDPTTMLNDVAVIDVLGPLSKQPSIWRLFGFDDHATLPEIEAAVRRAQRDEKVRNILLRVSSPGGTVAGTESLGNAIFAARQDKTVVCQVEDLACSAGYWLASQCERVYALRSADVANIGAMGTMYDYSGAFKELGIEAVVARSTPLKGIGVLGSEITAAQRAELDRWIGSKHELFVDAVTRGRGMDRAKVAKLADARVLCGDEALAAGLIDGIQGIDETLNELARGGAARAGRVSGSGSAGLSLGLSDGARAMDKRLRQYLESIGLEADASVETAWTFFNGLAGEQKRKADVIKAGQGDDGGQAGGDGGPAGRSASGGDSGGTDPPSGQAGNPGGSQVNGGQGGGQRPAPVQQPQAPSVSGMNRAEIQGLAEMAGLEGEALNQFVSMHTVGQTAEATVRQELVTIMRDRMPAVGGSRTVVGDDGRASLMAAMGDVFAERMGAEVSEPHARAQEFAALDSIECGRHWLASIGVGRAWSLPAETVAQAMIAPPFMLQQVVGQQIASAALTHSTSDFAGVLGTSANRSLAMGFDIEEVTYSAWARHEDLANLQQWEEHMVGGVPRPKRVQEGAEYELATIGEKKELKQVYKYGLKVALTLEMIINDTLGAFAERVFDFGGSARALRNELVYAQLTANPTMNEDSVALFHADHNNLSEGGAGAPNAARIDAARAAMRLQKGVARSGETSQQNLRITPTFILAAEELATTIQTLTASTVKVGGTNAEPNPQWLRSLIPVTDPELSDNSTTAWYLLGPKRKSPVKSLGLRGYSSPTIRREQVMSNDSLLFQLRDFAGAAVVEWRSAQKNAGG
jgi:signal peptide peptidase SppA